MAGRQTLRKAGWATVEWDWLGTEGDRVLLACRMLFQQQGERGKQLTWNGAAADMGATAFGNGDRAEGSSVRVLIRGWIS